MRITSSWGSGRLGTERMVEVEWEDSTGTHGWSRRSQLPDKPDTNHSLGYVIEDTDSYLQITEARVDDDETTEDVRHHPYGCATMIPRSAIRHVWELRREPS